jgi:hypothetical protein
MLVTSDTFWERLKASRVRKVVGPEVRKGKSTKAEMPLRRKAKKGAPHGRKTGTHSGP